MKYMHLWAQYQHNSLKVWRKQWKSFEVILGRFKRILTTCNMTTHLHKWCIPLAPKQLYSCFGLDESGRIKVNDPWMRTFPHPCCLSPLHLHFTSAYMVQKGLMILPLEWKTHGDQGGNPIFEKVCCLPTLIVKERILYDTCCLHFPLCSELKKITLVTKNFSLSTIQCKNDFESLDGTTKQSDSNGLMWPAERKINK